jgi:hypothetical protein
LLNNFIHKSIYDVYIRNEEFNILTSVPSASYLCTYIY